MPIEISVPDLAELKPRITVFGVGGGGCNAVNNMINSNLTGVEFVVANTDAQALAKSPCERKIQMGVSITEGLGAGSQPEIGAAAAEETRSEIEEHLVGSHMVFITAGMGGGTGTGAAPVIASLAREQGILTVGVVTKPFNFEGRRRMAIAERGIDTLAQHVDTLIVIPNQNLFRVANEATSFTAAFQMADQVLFSGVASITELMTKEGLINLDFADVRAVMSDMGKAMMGTGEASGERRAEEAAQAAISNPLLDIDSMAGARGVLISIAGGPDLTLYEVDQAASRIREEVDPEANIIVGATIEEELEGTMRVSVVATGLQQEVHQQGASQQQAGGNGCLRPPMGLGMGGAAGIAAPAAPAAQHRPTASAAPVGGAGASSSTSEEANGEASEQAVQPQGSAGQAPAAQPSVMQGSQGIDGNADTVGEEPQLPLSSVPEAADGENGGRIETSENNHSPAPEAPQQPAGQPDMAASAVAGLAGAEPCIPGVQEMPENIRILAEQKQERIRMLAAGAGTMTAPAGSTAEAMVTPARSVPRKRDMLIGKVKELFGRGQNAPQPERSTEQPRPIRQATAGNAASLSQGASHSPLAEDDGLNIPAFLRRK